MWPYIWTGMIARVRSVILRATSATSRHHVSGSQSTSTGVQPARTTAVAHEMIVKLGRITSDPRGSDSASTASSSAAVPFETATP